MSHIEGRLTKVLLSKPTVVTRAVLWKIHHNTEREDICLKLGRYKKSGPARYLACTYLQIGSNSSINFFSTLVARMRRRDGPLSALRICSNSAYVIAQNLNPSMSSPSNCESGEIDIWLIRAWHLYPCTGVFSLHPEKYRTPFDLR